MRVSPRTPGEPYGRVDRALLDQLANQTSGLIYALRRDAELQSTRRQALETVAEERAQLGRDLHDSIAPLLAGAGLTAEALRKGMTPGTTDEEDAERLASCCGTPPPKSGGSRTTCNPHQWTIAAPSSWQTTSPRSRHPRCHRSDSTDIAASLPTAVAQAAYLVVLEALNNVVGHADAQHCEVTVTLTPGELDLNVKDDGVGLKQPYVSGIGITSMRSRVQALGGTFNLTAAPDRGTLLQARIPVTP